jgi:hypothetical protein
MQIEMRRRWGDGRGVFIFVIPRFFYDFCGYENKAFLNTALDAMTRVPEYYIRDMAASYKCGGVILNGAVLQAE